MLANPWIGLDVNIRGLQNVLEASRIQGVQQVIFSSSTRIYGSTRVYGSTGVYGKIEDPPEEATGFNWETLPPALILYSGSKIVGGGLCRLYLQQHRLGYAALRYGNLYGENQYKRAIDATRVVTAWERIRAGLPPVIEDDGTQVTNFVDFGDVVRANLMAMVAAANGSDNICGDRDLRFNEIMAALLAACGSYLKPAYHVDTAKVAPATAQRSACPSPRRRPSLAGNRWLTSRKA